MQCTLCRTPLQNKIDHAYFECPKCRALVKDKILYESTEAEINRYLQHNNDVNDPAYQAFTSPITNYILENYKTHNSGLDFGSGTGPVISKVLKDHDYNIKQYDPYFANYPELLEKKYDYIACCEVIEHFYDPEKEFKLLRNILNPKGELICMTLLYRDDVDFSKWPYRLDPTHVFIYREKTIEYITHNFGFNAYEISNGRRIVWR